MSVIVIIGGGGGGGNQNLTVTEASDGGAFIEDASGMVVAKFNSVGDAIGYLQSLEGAGLSAEHPAE